MVFVSMKEILPKAKQEKYAVAQFNMNGLLWIQATFEVAERLNSPIILAASDRLISYLGGFETIYQMALTTYKEMKISIPVALHLDHGSTVEHCIKAIDAGFSSVMYDGSHLSIAENIQNTQQVCEYAKKYNVSVEAEVGSVGGTEDGVIGGIRYADVNECKMLVEETRVDALAAALGSVHGKYQGLPNLGFAEMEQISKEINIPLVLHGASGIPTSQLKKCIELGHAKINFNTELITSWADSVKKTIQEHPDYYEPKLIMEPAKLVLKEKMQQIILNLGSKDKV